MAKGRHRRPQQNQTTLPAGARVLTGKGRTAAKQAAYSLPLPVKLDLDGPAARSQSQQSSRHARPQQQQQHRSSYQAQSWRQYLATLVGWGASASDGQQQSATSARDQAVAAQKARPETITGQWDPLSRSVHVQVTRTEINGAHRGSSDGSGSDDRHDDHAMQQTEGMRMLWECGFFGKGTLSRSEPTWRSRQISTIKIKRQQARGQKIFTPEELTALRRKERKAAKIERARLAVRAGQQLADGIVALGGELTEEDERTIASEVQRELEGQQQSGADTESGYGKHIPGLIYLKPKEEEKNASRTSADASDAAQVDTEGTGEGDEDFIDVEDMETLQLSSYETLFLAGMLGILEVLDEQGNLLPLEHIYALLLSDRLPVALSNTSPLKTPSADLLALSRDHWSRPDNPFLLTYVAYHHFRSLGWVVRSGIKFCVDLLLYKKGPAFSHAEFAVVVLPVYENPDDAASSPFGTQAENKHVHDWVWFSSVNRVNTQVLKTLVLCYVVIPPLHRISSESLCTPQGFVDGLQSGRSYHVREYAVRRFTPQRMRA